MANIKIIEEDAQDELTLHNYATIPIAFQVNARFAVQAVENGSGGLRLTEERVTPPFWKNYDADEDEGPGRWKERFDLSHWGVLGAFIDGERVGGAAIAWNTPGVDMLEGRTDLAELWDLRVRPECRGHGVGFRLFQVAVAWARARACLELKVETQDINVAACRFYARQGCELRTVQPGVYPDFPHEVRLLWHLRITPA